jgi:hypothetical protein
MKKSWQALYWGQFNSWIFFYGFINVYFAKRKKNTLALLKKGFLNGFVCELWHSFLNDPLMFAKGNTYSGNVITFSKSW